MKKVIVLLMILPVAAFSQNKKDNAIIIHENISMDNIITALFDNGFEINKTTETYVSTEPKEMNAWSVKILINKSDSALIMKGLFNVPLLFKDFTPVEYRGMKGSLFQKSWAELDKVAKKISNEIEYIKQ